ncbi:MAG: hypothetical protein M1837_001690 [Sclerophora amabilis]|nr:MAG: hypothetical protein M1837_001690 [Sclerophora amabilis]
MLFLGQLQNDFLVHFLIGSSLCFQGIQSLPSMTKRDGALPEVRNADDLAKLTEPQCKLFSDAVTKAQSAIEVQTEKIPNKKFEFFTTTIPTSQFSATGERKKFSCEKDVSGVYTSEETFRANAGVFYCDASDQIQLAEKFAWDGTKCASTRLDYVSEPGKSSDIYSSTSSFCGCGDA